MAFAMANHEELLRAQAGGQTAASESHAGEEGVSKEGQQQRAEERAYERTGAVSPIAEVDYPERRSPDLGVELVEQQRV